MIRRSRSPHRIAFTAACLALAGVRLGAEHEARSATEKSAPAEKSSVTPVPAEAVKPGEQAEKSAESAAQPEEKPAKSTQADKPKRAANEFEGLLNLGAQLTERGDFEAADIAYRQVLNTPKAPEQHIKTALLGLAHMHRKQGALTKACAIFERYIKDYPGDERMPDALLDLGRTLRSLGTYKLAIARFYSVINSTLKLPGEGFERYQVLAKTAQFEIAETHFQAGDFAEASKFYTRLRLLDLAPADRARAHFKAGYALRLQGDLEGTVRSLRAYIEEWPDDENIPEARYLLAITLRELKRTQEAFAVTFDLLRAEQARVATDPKRWAYWQRRTGNQLANDFFETGDTLNARTIYSRLLELAPEPQWRLPITYQVALCDERLGATENARNAYQSIVDAAGANPPAELAEIVKMAAWRIEHLAWRDGVTRQITTFFETTTGKQATATPPATAPTKTASTP
jgi:TolA-binding protein